MSRSNKIAIAILMGAWAYPLTPTGDTQLLSAVPFALGCTWAALLMAIFAPTCNSKKSK